MAYNKSKHLEAAQKHLHQGKVAQAIAEYQQVLKHEPKDQVTLMTIGDLYVRQGETFQALEYFERLAHIFLADGFITKAIAIYKKIAKLAPEQTQPVERLAELYVQQGVLSEARPIYLQLAEMHQRAGRHPQAAALLRKLLDAEPDNLRVQTRLAELSLTMNQPADAVATFRSAAQQLYSRGDHNEVIQYADRALKIDPSDVPTLTLKASALAAAGRRDAAVLLLESLPHLDAGGEPADVLLHLYLDGGDTKRASELAAKIFARSSKHFAPAHNVADILLEAGEPGQALALLDLIREAMTDAGEHEQLSKSLTRAAERLPGQVEPLEWLVELYGRTSDSFRLSDALANLAEACEAAGLQERARQLYEQLLDRDPESEGVRRKYGQLQARMGLGDGTPRKAAEPPVAEPGAPPPHKDIEPLLDEEAQRFVTQALTDVDLFSSYGLAQKAIDLLETVLQRAPRHAVTLERLLDLYLGAGNERRTSELAALLQQIHRERGNTASADRFAELHRRFERAAGLAAEEVAAPHAAAAPPLEFSVPMVEAEPMSSGETEQVGEPVATEPVVHEVDLSEEWAALSGQIGDVAPPLAIEFPVVQGEPPALADEAVAANQPAELLDEVPADTSAEYTLELESQPNGMSADDFLRSLSSELDAALPALVAAEPMAPAREESAQASAPVPRESIQEESSGPLSEVFDEFRAQMGELAPEKEDLETHYNLGIAYREMGLLEEAISEFQKVAKANNKGQAFRYAMQCCTLLGLAFMEKGQPSIAAMWYERALETPGLDQESILALRYDLGVAQELAGDGSAARKSFSQVYGMNIDYRDVAERLAALGKGR